MKKIIILIIIVAPLITFSQEWKSLKKYRKATEKDKLEEGNWLKKDRKRNTLKWLNSNKFHLKKENGYTAYKTISQRRDFYKWFDSWRIKKGHEIKWVGIASIIASQFSKFDSKFVAFLIRNKEVIKFANEGNKASFKDVFPRLHKIYLLDTLIVGTSAVNWDSKYLYREQCIVVDPIFNKLNRKTLKKIGRIANRKGFYKMAIPKKIKFDGDISNCKDRYEHGMNRLIPFYQSKKKL